MNIQKIAVSQLDEILDLVLWIETEALSIDNPDGRAWIKNKMRKFEASGCEFFGLFDDDKLIGFATILIEDRPAIVCDGYGACELLQIGIVSEYRKEGYGSMIMQHIEQYLMAKKVYCLYLHTYAPEYSVVAFYGKNGYIPRGVIPDVYGPDFDGMLYMSKTLNNKTSTRNP